LDGNADEFEPVATIEPIRMTGALSQLEMQANVPGPFGRARLLTVADLSAAIGVSPGWVTIGCFPIASRKPARR
jgi:hypothetical protein